MSSGDASKWIDERVSAEEEDKEFRSEVQSSGADVYSQ